MFAEAEEVDLRLGGGGSAGVQSGDRGTLELVAWCGSSRELWDEGGTVVGSVGGCEKRNRTLKERGNRKIPMRRKIVSFGPVPQVFPLEPFSLFLWSSQGDLQIAKEIF